MNNKQFFFIVGMLWLILSFVITDAVLSAAACIMSFVCGGISLLS